MAKTPRAGRRGIRKCLDRAVARGLGRGMFAQGLDQRLADKLGIVRHLQKAVEALEQLARAKVPL